jgi:hypothetical protein
VSMMINTPYLRDFLLTTRYPLLATFLPHALA